jgi:hypothetical protein
VACSRLFSVPCFSCRSQGRKGYQGSAELPAKPISGIVMKLSSFLKTVSKEQTKDFGMVISLACLFVAYVTHEKWALQLSILLLLINIVYSPVYKPFASVWFSLSELIGGVVSKLILTLVFALLVIPIGVLRRALGKDSLQLKKWKKDGSSVFKVRDHAYGPEDMDKPY